MLGGLARNALAKKSATASARTMSILSTILMAISRGTECLEFRMYSIPTHRCFYVITEIKNEAMDSRTGEIIKRKAAFIVLNRLGEEMFEVVRYHLRRSYAITLDLDDPSQFSLEQLHFALSVMLGNGSANNMLRQVVDEIRDLMQYRSYETPTECSSADKVSGLVEDK